MGKKSNILEDKQRKTKDKNRSQKERFGKMESEDYSTERRTSE